MNEPCPIDVEARFTTHVVNVKLEIAAVHDGQHQAQRILGLVRVSQRYDELRIDLLQDILLDEYHGLAFAFLYALFLELFASVHLASGANLTGANLAKAAFAQHPVHAEGLVRDGLTLEPLPLQIPERAI